MGEDNQLLITYGAGYAFKNSKLLGIIEVAEKVILEKDADIIEEINELDELTDFIYEEANLKFKEEYVESIEELLEDELLKVFPMIVSVIDLNTGKVHKFMEKYQKNDLTQIRIMKEEYIAKSLIPAKQFLDKCFGKEEKNSKNNCSIYQKNKLTRYNQMLLRIILTSSYGDSFSDFIVNNDSVH